MNNNLLDVYKNRQPGKGIVKYLQSFFKRRPKNKVLF
jgi:hypothetical protein